MKDNKKHFDIKRIVENAETLSHPEIYECFLYECEDPDGFADVEAEIDELSSLLPQGINVLDLPDTIVGNMQTKIYGTAICSATNGHSIVLNDSIHRILFDGINEAKNCGYRPCAKCMPQEYKNWKDDKKK